MISPLDKELLCVDDVLLEPKLGKLKSRSDAEIKPFIYSAPMDTVTGYELAKAMLAQNQIPVICRELSDKEYINCLQEFSATEAFFAAGATIPELLRLCDRMLKADLPEGTKINVAIDIAHGDSFLGHFATKRLREEPFIRNIMSGSICTAAAAQRCIEAGCTHLRVGVGPGSVCTTRLMTGCGVPQLSAVYLIGRYLQDYKLDNIVLIADGGIRYPGDAVKYLAAGADAVMMGNAFCKTKESAGWTYQPWVLGSNLPMRTQLRKQYRGHASKSFSEDNKKNTDCPEGISTNWIEPEGTVEEVCKYYIRGLAGAISYLGLTSLNDLCPENVDFLRITANTILENKAHNDKA